jgi:hypothetical protein
VAKADNKSIDDNQLNLNESNFSFVKAQNLLFKVFEPTPFGFYCQNFISIRVNPFQNPRLSVVAEGVGFEPTRPRKGATAPLNIYFTSKN